MGGPDAAPHSEHLVQIYDSDETLVRYVATYLSTALLHGEAALIVATPDHRAAFVAALASRGFDVPVLRADGRLLVLDAEETLAGFTAPGDTPDRELFTRHVGAQVRALRERHGAVSIYGEMVACMWQRGDAVGAVLLEGMWNELAQSEPFRLFCAYSDSCLGSAGDAAQVQAVFDTHTHVLR